MGKMDYLDLHCYICGMENKESLYIILGYGQTVHAWQFP